MNALIESLRSGLQPLVRDGLISEERAMERARNMAAILVGEFDLHPIGDDGEPTGEILS